MDWQTYLALAIVLLTVCVFAWRLFRSGKSKSACGSDCSCEVKKKRPIA